MKLLRKSSERGFSLITAVVIITLLVFLGTMVLQQVANDVQLAGGDRASANALYIAEAGAVWGKQQLINTVYPNGTTTGNPAALTTLTQLSAGDSLCPDGANCAAYYLLSPSQQTSYSNGWYKVGVSCTPACTGTPTSYTIRSLGQTPDGAARLIELTVGY